MKTIEQKRAKVRKSQKALRKRLIKQGICRDCGQNPAAQIRTDTRKRRPTFARNAGRSAGTRLDGAALSKAQQESEERK